MQVPYQSRDKYSALLQGKTRDELNLIAKHLNISGFRKLSRDTLIQTILDKTPESNLERLLTPSWWTRYHIHVYGVAGLIGLALTVLFFLWPRFQSRPNTSNPQEAVPSAVSTPAPSPTKATASPTPVAVQEERILLDVKPEYLLDFFTKYNNVQAQKLVETYIGKWEKFSGEVFDVSPDDTVGGHFPDSGPHVMISIRKKNWKDNFGVYCSRFEEQRWKDRALVLKPGETITLLGRIKQIRERSFWLEKCEFVE
jgi:hypothetical protein